MRAMTMAAAAGAVILAAATAAQAAPAIPAYITAAVNDPGRPAKDKAADAERKPAEIVAFAGVKPGDIVVDFWPGGGYFTRIFAKIVGPKGHIYDFVPDELVKNMSREAHGTDNFPKEYPNVSIIHQPVDHFHPPQKVDVFWISQNYHDLHNPPMGPANMMEFNRNIYNALKPNGVYFIEDHVAPAGSGTSDTNTLHRIDPLAALHEVTSAGFALVATSNVLRNPNDPHNIIVFNPKIRGHTDQFLFKFMKTR